VHVSASGTVVLTRFRDCDQALRDRRLGKVDESLGFRLTPVPAELQRRAMRRFRKTMLFRNPPDHARLRSLVADVFTARHVQDLHAYITAATDQLIDTLADHGRGDIITDLALPLPVAVISHLFGLPEDGREFAAPLVRDLIAPLEPAADTAAVERAAAAEDQPADYIGAVLEHKRRHPAEDLLSRLATADGDHRLDHDECVGTGILLFAAGFETTTNLIGNATAALLDHPEQAALLRQRPDLASNAVEELLRWEAPVQTDGRTALHQTEIAGTTIHPGQVVLTLIGAANRDPEHFEHPDVLDLARHDVSPLSFGAGIHYCLGAALERMEGATVLPRLVTRLPDLRSNGPAVWRPGLSFRGLLTLPVSIR
jgi:cytochrome P450